MTPETIIFSFLGAEPLDSAWPVPVHAQPWSPRTRVARQRMWGWTHSLELRPALRHNIHTYIHTYKDEKIARAKTGQMF